MQSLVFQIISFQNPEDPFKEIPAASYTIDFQPHIAANNNFIAVKIGDLNHSVIANNDALFIEGLQLSLGTDDSKLPIQSITGIPRDAYTIERNQAIISLTAIEGLAYSSDETLFSITFAANNDGQLKEHLFLNEEEIANEWYDTNIEAHSFQLSFEEIGIAFSVANNYPNPFEGRTSLPFTLPAAGNISINIFNNNGQVIWQKQASFPKGLNTIELAANYPSSGIYFYEVAYGEERVRGKLHVIR